MTTLRDVIENPPAKLTVQETAAIMGVTPRFLQVGLQQKEFPFGVAVKMGKWRYYINTIRFINYMLDSAEQRSA